CIREIEAEIPISITGMLMDANEKRLQKKPVTAPVFIPILGAVAV
ncbi:hypothetical protein, partial [Enterobacter hormaechei]